MWKLPFDFSNEFIITIAHQSTISERLHYIDHSLLHENYKCTTSSYFDKNVFERTPEEFTPDILLRRKISGISIVTPLPVKKRTNILALRANQGVFPVNSSD